METLYRQSCQQSQTDTRLVESIVWRTAYESRCKNSRRRVVLKYIINKADLKRLASLREKYHKMVDEIFNSHENSLRMQVRQHYRVDLPDTSKLKMAIEEMEKVLMKLAHSNSALPALKKALLLDHKALL